MSTKHNMKFSFLAVALFVLISSLVLVNCGGGGGGGDSTSGVAVIGVSLNKSTTNILVNGSEQLTATITPVNATNQAITWSSSDTAVATVSTTGFVTAVSSGNATITATTADGAFSATCQVTVSTTPVAVTGVSLNKSTTSLLVSGSEQLTATITPANATNQVVTWSSSDTVVATVSATGLVTAAGSGSATITVTTADGAFSASCLLTATSVAVTGVSLNKSITQILAYGSEQLTATMTPANATNPNVTWSSSDTAVATVSETGVVTVAALGSATITATTVDGAFVATCIVAPRYAKSTAFDVSGGTMVVWTQYDGSYNTVYAKRRDGTSGTWGTTIAIGYSTGNASFPQVGYNANNNAIVVWLQKDGTYNRLYSNRYNTALGTWGTPTLIGPVGNYNEAFLPQMDFDVSGGTMVVWTQNDGTYNRVYANRHNGTFDTWGTATLIEAGSENALFPQIGYDVNDKAIVVWLQNNGNYNRVYANRYDTTFASWGTSTLIGPSTGGEASLPRMDFDVSGGTMVVWTQYDGSYNSVYANRRNGTFDAWGTATLIEANTGNASLPQVGYNANNNAMVVWLQNDGTHNSVYANKYNTAFASWGTSTRIGPSTGEAAIPRMDFDVSGGSMVVWTQYDGTYNSVYANRHNGTFDTWGTATIIESNTGNASLPQIGYNANNNAMVVWLQNDGTHNSVYANKYNTAFASWGTSTLIGSALGNASLPEMDFDVSGGSMVTWTQYDGAYNSVYANRHNGTFDIWGAATLLESNSGNASLPSIGVRRAPPGRQGFTGKKKLFYDVNNMAIITWLQYDGAYNSVYANRYDTGFGVWGTATLIENNTGNACFP